MQKVRRTIQQHPIVWAVVGLAFTGLPAVEAWWGLFSEKPLAEAVHAWLQGPGPVSVPTPSFPQLLALLPSAVGLCLLLYIAYVVRSSTEPTGGEDVGTDEDEGDDIGGTGAGIEDQPEPGLFDLYDQASTATKEVVGLANELSQATVSLGRQLNEYSDRINKSNKKGRELIEEVRPIVMEAADEVSNYATLVDELEEPLGNNIDKALDSWSRAATIWREDLDWEEGVEEENRQDLIQGRDAAEELASQLASADKTVGEFAETINAWPRISKEIIQAKAQAHSVLTKLQSRLGNGASKARRIVSQFDELIEAGSDADAG